MEKLTLNGAWKARNTSQDNWIDAIVPGSFLNDMLENKLIPDPFFRTNEYATRDIFENDFEYERTFMIEKNILENEVVELNCEGLDTLCEIFINGKSFVKTNNMHRTWIFNIKDALVIGENKIKIFFASPLQFIKGKNEEAGVTYTATGSTPGNGFIRKAHSMYGWDWGPQLPDVGIFRNIFITYYSNDIINDFYFTQTHLEDKVNLSLEITTKLVNLKTTNKVKLDLASPCGKTFTTEGVIQNNKITLSLDINSPLLWWPNGWGLQNLYNAKITLLADNTSVDEKTVRIGLRTMTVSQDKDQWGNEFAITVNGNKIFAMGADYIPEDSVLKRVTYDTTKKLISSCAEANFNCIRVWGGGYYPDDFFFDLCDEYGMIIWQDLMFACNVYVMTEEFEENIVAETIDNVKRIRHHACLGLWCGNNEMEFGWVDWDRVKYHHEKLKADYIKQFEYVLPKVVKQHDPNNFYWPASPSSGGNFFKPNDENMGDVHYWDVWHSLVPFTAYRDYYFRFCSEFGFQSMPCMKTVDTFAIEEDKNIFSEVMESHQKNGSANGRILFYLSDNYLYPKDFGSLLYISQILQAQAIKYGVEHWRRNRGRCMGAIYWQLNDCWPVTSWASIDYCGRWKALQYDAKRFFAPVTISVEDKDFNLDYFAHNDSLNDIDGVLKVCLKNDNFKVIYSETTEFKLEKLSAKSIKKYDFEKLINSAGISKDAKNKIFASYELFVNNKLITSGSNLFVKPKHYKFEKATYLIDVMENDDSFTVNISSSSYQKYVEVSFEDFDVIMSDNYFDIINSLGIDVTIFKDRVENLSEEMIRKNIKLQSISDTN